MLNTSTVLIPENSILTERQRSILKRVRVDLAKSTTRKIAKAVEEDPDLDFEQLLNEAYRARLLAARKTAEKRCHGTHIPSSLHGVPQIICCRVDPFT